MNKEKLLELADHVERTPAPAPDQTLDIAAFHMSAYLYDETCLTHRRHTACLAGHAVLLHGSGAQKTRMRDNPTTAHGTALTLLGLSAAEADNLFTPPCSRSVLLSCADPALDDYVSPARAAKVVRAFVKNGEVDWTIR